MPYFSERIAIDDSLLNVLAHLPTRSLSELVDPKFWPRLSDADFMRIAVHLARKSYGEGGCPIGGVIVDNVTRRIWARAITRSFKTMIPTIMVKRQPCAMLAPSTSALPRCLRR